MISINMDYSDSGATSSEPPVWRRLVIRLLGHESPKYCQYGVILEKCLISSHILTGLSVTGWKDKTLCAILKRYMSKLILIFIFVSIGSIASNFTKLYYIILRYIVI